MALFGAQYRSIRSAVWLYLEHSIGLFGALLFPILPIFVYSSRQRPQLFVIGRRWGSIFSLLSIIFIRHWRKVLKVRSELLILSTSIQCLA